MYEIDKPEIKELLQSIARRIGPSLPTAWGFLLMLYEFGTDQHPGSTFYISNGDRKDCVKLLQDWLERQGADGVVNAAPSSGTQAARKMREEWHKVVAMLLVQRGVREASFTIEDVTKLSEIPDASVVFGGGGDPNVLTVRLVSGDEARQLALAQEEKERHATQ